MLQIIVNLLIAVAVMGFYELMLIPELRTKLKRAKKESEFKEKKLAQYRMMRTRPYLKKRKPNRKEVS